LGVFATELPEALFPLSASLAVSMIAVKANFQIRTTFRKATLVVRSNMATRVSIAAVSRLWRDYHANIFLPEAGGNSISSVVTDCERDFAVGISESKLIDRYEFV
jgi:hypothetical protein